VKNRILSDFDVNEDNFENEPWFETIIKSECLKDSCDEVAHKMSDMLSVSSSELGSVMRKLKYTYQQSFQQMMIGWKNLRLKYLETLGDLNENRRFVEELNVKMLEKEYDIRERIDAKVGDVKKQFQAEREKDREKITQSEYQLEQMSATLKNLNAIFKTMQSDVDAAKSADTLARCNRLEREVAELESKCLHMEKIKKELLEEKDKVTSLTKNKAEMTTAILSMQNEIARRDATISELMERETLRNAELEKLNRMAAQRAENDEDLNLDPIASSVLCIRCKKSLDDISNIREAILGTNSTGQHLMCQSFRVLLPNNKGKRPFRSNQWLKVCMRSILTSKVDEIQSMMPIGGEISGFPEFVYSWFEPYTEGLDSSKVQNAMAQADEDRWGLYYGVKAMAKDNAEAKLFWSLLDETQGEDGMVFASHCLSVALCIGGKDLWRQFGAHLNYKSYAAIPPYVFTEAYASNIAPTIWLDLDSAATAVKLILVRALKTQVQEALDAIEALQAAPSIDSEDPNDPNAQDDIVVNKDTPAEPKAEVIVEKPATHIDFYMWLRILLQRFQDEQCHRQAAIRLMFDTASMGALLPSGTGGFVEQHDSDNPQVYFPQFVGVVRTLYPTVSITELAEMFVLCYKEGGCKVTPTVFLSVAEKKKLFSRAMQLSPLPLFEFWKSREEEKIDLENENNPGGTTIAASDKVDPPPSNNQFGFDMPIFDVSYGVKTRSQIGSLIHRKFTLMLPEIIHLSRGLSERWRNVLSEAIDRVRVALQEYFVKLKTDTRGKRVLTSMSSTDGSMMAGKKEANSKSNERFIDGLTPYIQYHRLLVLVLTIRSFSENSLLPLNLLAKKEKHSQRVILSSGRAESILSKIEDALFSNIMQPLRKRKCDLFDLSRRSIFARKIQMRYRKFIVTDIIIPRSIRSAMRSGYFRLGSSQLTLRSRRVYMEPWSAHVFVGNIYTYKLAYDMKASRLGKPVVPFSVACLSMATMLFSSSEIADRVMQDICLAVQTTMHGMPRLRMFACFLGFGELEQPIGSLFTTDLAVGMYLELLILIHVELGLRQGKIIDSVDELFSTSEDPATRSDKRDTWCLPVEVLKGALTKWSSMHYGVKESVYTNAMTRVKTDANGIADVDDFLWVMMQMWGKFVVAKFKLCEDKAVAHATRDGINRNPSKKNITALSNSPSALAEQARKTSQRLQRTSTTTLMDSKIESAEFKGISFPHFGSSLSLQNAVESLVNQPIVSDDYVPETTSLIHCAASLVQSAAKSRHASVKSYYQLLQQCVMWDCSTGPCIEIKMSETEEEIKLSLSNNSAFRLRLPVKNPSSPILTIRLLMVWWNANKRFMMEGVDQVY
jgi:hypothetical protein